MRIVDDVQLPGAWEWAAAVGFRLLGLFPIYWGAVWAKRTHAEWRYWQEAGTPVLTQARVIERTEVPQQFFGNRVVNRYPYVEYALQYQVGDAEYPAVYKTRDPEEMVSIGEERDVYHSSTFPGVHTTDMNRGGAMLALTTWMALLVSLSLFAVGARWALFPPDAIGRLRRSVQEL